MLYLQMWSKTQICLVLSVSGSVLSPVSVQLPWRQNFTSKEKKKKDYIWPAEWIFQNTIWECGVV